MQNVGLQSSARLQGKEGVSRAAWDLSLQLFGVITAMKMDMSKGIVQS